MSESWEQRMAYVLLRVAMGVDFLGHGTIRLLHGNVAFAQGMVKQMTETPLPSAFVYGFGWILPFVEFAIGVLLVAGLWTRWALGRRWPVDVRAYGGCHAARGLAHSGIAADLFVPLLGSAVSATRV